MLENTLRKVVSFQSVAHTWMASRQRASLKSLPRNGLGAALKNVWCLVGNGGIHSL